MPLEIGSGRLPGDNHSRQLPHYCFLVSVCRPGHYGPLAGTPAHRRRHRRCAACGLHRMSRDASCRDGRADSCKVTGQVIAIPGPVVIIVVRASLHHVVWIWPYGSRLLGGHVWPLGIHGRLARRFLARLLGSCGRGREADYPAGPAADDPNASLGRRVAEAGASLFSSWLLGSFSVCPTRLISAIQYSAKAAKAPLL